MRLEIGLTGDLATCLAIRRVVFIEEQGVSLADEVDGRDGEAEHLLARLDGQPVGTARMLVAGEAGKIGRVAVLEGARGKGIGATLIRAAVARLRERGLKVAKLGAQTQALGFYEGLGFTAFGPVYDDAGILHRDMKLEL